MYPRLAMADLWHRSRLSLEATQVLSSMTAFNDPLFFEIGDAVSRLLFAVLTELHGT